MAEFQEMTETAFSKDASSVVCVKALGIAVDDKGAPAYGAVKVKFNGVTLPPYPELIKRADPMELLKELGILDAFEVSDAQFITQEEYDKDYGDEHDEDSK